VDAAHLRQILTLSNDFKEGDLAVGGTTDGRVRADARATLLATTLGSIRRTTLIDDGVTDALARARDPQFDGVLDSLTVADVRARLLGRGGADWGRTHHAALSSEAIAAVAKVMTNDDLSAVARTLSNPLDGDGIAIGSRGHFGSRIQPNSPGDDDEEILFSILEGLAWGCGDVVIGLNPAADDVDTIVRLERLLEDVVTRLSLPTRFCVLSDIVKQQTARQRTRIDVAFQSLAGTSSALKGMVGLDANGVCDLAKSFGALYFETGQGSEVTNGCAEGIDMVTLEARTYGVARYIRQEADVPWTIVNDVAGFIGPEVFRTGEQLERTCLEDTVMARLHGLTFGLDVCATFHMGIAPRELRTLTARIVEEAAPAYLMAVAGKADPMLGYLTTSFREHPQLARRAGRAITTAMSRRLAELGVDPARTARDGAAQTCARLFGAFAGAIDEDAAIRRLNALRHRGFDLGTASAAEADARVDAIYAHARRALYAVMRDTAVEDACGPCVRVTTQASDRDDYLSHPPTGERIPEAGASAIAAAYRAHRPQVLLVVSDGLNAEAVNEQVPQLLAPLLRALGERGCAPASPAILVRNGRVRAGYEIAGIAGAEAVVHVIGERPGTGLNTLSAYLTYGRDAHGALRWSRDLDHSATTAICGIHPRGKPPAAAAAEIASVVRRMLDARASGVALSGAR
jgi:ethanolamine ammonia-lyase large subunit